VSKVLQQCCPTLQGSAGGFAPLYIGLLVLPCRRCVANIINRA
jgi:hypothetical protein